MKSLKITINQRLSNIALISIFAAIAALAILSSGMI